MNRITISLIFLIVISMFFPASAIMYASGQTDDNNSGGSSNGDGTTMDNNISSNGDGSSTMDNNISSNGGETTNTTTDNSTTLPTTSTASNNTGNAQQQSSNTRNLRIGPCPYNENITCDNPEPVNNTNTTSTPYVVNKNSSDYLVGYKDAISYGYVDVSCLSLPNITSVQNDCGAGYGDGIDKLADPTFQQSADYVNGMLAAHNRERAAVGSPPLVWNDTLAAGAKAWAEHLSTTGELYHDISLDSVHEGENIASNLSNGPNLWINEKNDYHGNVSDRAAVAAALPTSGHYLQMVWPYTKQVGCASSSSGHTILDCRYSPVVLGQ